MAQLGAEGIDIYSGHTEDVADGGRLFRMLDTRSRPFVEKANDIRTIQE